MLTQSNEFREQLLALLHRFGMPKSTLSFTLTCAGGNASMELSATYMPEAEVDTGAIVGLGDPEATDLVEVWPLGSAGPELMRGRQGA